jgi:hypothetical protein
MYSPKCLSAAASVQGHPQAPTATLLTRVRAAKQRIPLLANFLDTFPKKGAVSHMQTVFGSQSEKKGTEAYLKTMSPSEKTLIVTHYKDLKDLFDAKIAGSDKKKGILTTSLNKVLIEGCILLHTCESTAIPNFLESGHPTMLLDKIGKDIEGFTSENLIKLTHTPPRALNKDMVQLIHIQLRELSTPTQTTFSSININDLKETVKTLFQHSGEGLRHRTDRPDGGAEAPDPTRDRRPTSPASTTETPESPKIPSKTMRTNEGATLATAIDAGRLIPWITAKKDMNPEGPQARITNVINPPPITPADMGGATGTANGDTATQAEAAPHIQEGPAAAPTEAAEPDTGTRTLEAKYRAIYGGGNQEHIALAVQLGSEFMHSQGTRDTRPGLY